jgi:hypothetical protein
MATLMTPAPAPEAATVTLLPAAVLTGGVDGYPAGSTGWVAGRRQGCVVFVPDAPEVVARWARPRTTLLVPPAMLVEL